MARYIPEGREPPYYGDSRGWRESKTGPVYPTLDDAAWARRFKGNPYYKPTKEQNISPIWVVIYLLALVIFTVCIV